jgi:hypothetical protein
VYYGLCAGIFVFGIFGGEMYTILLVSRVFLQIPPCTFFRKKYQKLSDGCLACSWRPNAGNGRLIAGLQANLPRFSRF